MRRWVSLIPLFIVIGNGCRSGRSVSSPIVPTVRPSGGDGGDIDMAVAAPAPVADMSNGGCGCNDLASGDMTTRNPAGPWPTDDLTIYGVAQGLSSAIIDANPDDGQNIWAAARDTLYLLRPGTTTFQAFTVADGLHITPFVDPYHNSTETFMTAIAGGADGQVYVGYQGYETTGNPFLDPESLKELGNGDDVKVGSDGTLGITRLLFRCDAERGAGCWENRSPRRIFYMHQGIAAGHSFWGFNHGVTHVLGDDFGDHVHPEVWWEPKSGPTGIEKIGEFYGIAVDAMGNCWMAGRYGVGLQPWDPKPNGGPLSDTSTFDEWVSGSFLFAFTTDTSNHTLGFPSGPWVANGYAENNRGAAVGPDGILWLARLSGGLVSWDPKSGSYSTIRHWPEVPGDLLDLQADPDGTLWLVNSSAQLLRFDPTTHNLRIWPGVNGVLRIYVDVSVTPRAVYVSKYDGLAVIRAK
jgi:hypothetical protein